MPNLDYFHRSIVIQLHRVFQRNATGIFALLYRGPGDARWRGDEPLAGHHETGVIEFSRN